MVRELLLVVSGWARQDRTHPWWLFPVPCPWRLQSGGPGANLSRCTVCVCGDSPGKGGTGGTGLSPRGARGWLEECGAEPHLVSKPTPKSPWQQPARYI